MNINQMMKQAQQMQAKVEQAQAELESREFAFETQGIKIKMLGNKTILGIDIDKDLLDEDNKEILEDMLMVAINGIIGNVEAETNRIMSEATGNFKIPGM